MGTARGFSDVRARAARVPPLARLARVAPLERVRLARGQVLHEPGERIGAVYFPIEAVVALVSVLRDGAVEAGLVGREGVVGLPALLGVPVADRRAVCLIPGEAWRAPAAAVRRAVGAGGAGGADAALSRRVPRYAHAALREATQLTACVALHPVERRCARWLLTVADRLGADAFPLTQKRMAESLGVRRASVVEALGALARAGLLAHGYGTVAITDRAGLAAAACECYAALRSAAASLRLGA